MFQVSSQYFMSLLKYKRLKNTIKQTNDKQNEKGHTFIGTFSVFYVRSHISKS